MKKTIICGAVLVASIIPALADQYWVVQDSNGNPGRMKVSDARQTIGVPLPVTRHVSLMGSAQAVQLRGVKRMCRPTTRAQGESRCDSELP
jgi:hypothetical protein